MPSDPSDSAATGNSEPLPLITLRIAIFFLALSLALIPPRPALAQQPGTFSSTGSLQTDATFQDLWDLATAPILDGKIFVSGGFITQNESADAWYRAQVYFPPPTGQFAFTGPSMIFTRAQHTSTLLTDGDILIAGGDPQAAELYHNGDSPGAAEFLQTGNLPVSLANSTATLLSDGRVLIVGGEDNCTFQCVPQAHPDAALYDPASGTFSSTSPLSVGRVGHTATLLPNGKVLIAGGTSDAFLSQIFSTAEVYDPMTGLFSAPINMTTQRAFHTATLLNNGTVLIAGGWINQNGELLAHGSAELFDPSSNTFTATSNLINSRAYATATLLPNGEVLLAGGKSSGLVGEAELFDPSTATFNATGTMQVPRELHHADLLSNGQVLIIGGDKVNSRVFTSELYTPPSMPAVKIIAPIANSIVRDTVLVPMTVSSNVTWANLYVDGNYVASSPPYTFQWNSTSTPVGAHTLSTRVYNASGTQIGTDSIRVSVQRDAIPIVKITAPTPDQSVNGNVPIDVSIVSSAVQWVNIYIDGVYFASSPPYNFTWSSTSVSNGPHTISAIGYSGSQKAGASYVRVTVSN